MHQRLYGMVCPYPDRNKTETPNSLKTKYSGAVLPLKVSYTGTLGIMFFSIFLVSTFSASYRSRLRNGPAACLQGSLGWSVGPQLGVGHQADDQTLSQVPDPDWERRGLHAHVLHQGRLCISGGTSSKVNLFLIGSFRFRSASTNWYWPCVLSTRVQSIYIRLAKHQLVK